MATCWSLAMARSASPVRLPWKNQLRAAMHAPAMAAATSLSGETGTPWMTTGSRGRGRAIPPGTPANTRAAEPRMKIPRPIVTMISESSDRLNSRRRTTRLKAIATDHPDASEAERSTEPEPERVHPGGDHPRPQHDPFAHGEVDHPGGLVHDHEGQGDEGVDGAGQRSVHDEKREKHHVRHGGVSTRLPQPAPRYAR